MSMASEFHLNGKLVVVLKTADPIERAILQRMAELAQKGARITLEGSGDGEYCVSVER